jgi:hypothetical protein
MRTFTDSRPLAGARNVGTVRGDLAIAFKPRFSDRAVVLRSAGQGRLVENFAQAAR